jgi:hypothetical protein
MKQLIIIALLVITNEILLSCNATTVKQSSESDKNYQAIDTIIRDIPLYIQQPAFKRMFAGFEDRLGLASLANGINGVELRLWYTHDKTDTVQLLVIKYTNSNWSAKLFTAIYKMNKANDSLLSLNETLIKKEPKFGWDVLVDSLFTLNIDILPDYTKLSGYKQNMGGDGILVEFADTKRYRIYSYPEPDFNKNELIEAKMMTQILRLIEDHLQFKWL